MTEQKPQPKPDQDQPKPEPGKPVPASVPNDGSSDDAENVIPHVKPE